MMSRASRRLFASSSRAYIHRLNVVDNFLSLIECDVVVAAVILNFRDSIGAV